VHNKRLLEYVRSGGNIVCFYHKTGDWNGKNYSPYPIFLTNERVTQEDAPVRELLPRHLLLTLPNNISPMTGTTGFRNAVSICRPRILTRHPSI